jgi:DNA-binding transcriptional regulator YiaG
MSDLVDRLTAEYEEATKTVLGLQAELSATALRRGRSLAELRRVLGVSRPVLAERLGVSVSLVQKLEERVKEDEE